ncbi:hypothetical protein NHQ30_004444 [Ciborinia camelliae]|nr:hypothetical protein NHQ30_004444 [Ciborinia camelliae]
MSHWRLWVYDRCAPNHITPCRADFTEYREVEEGEIGEGVIGIGTVILVCYICSTMPNVLTLKDVHHIPDHTHARYFSGMKWEQTGGYKNIGCKWAYLSDGYRSRKFFMLKKGVIIQSKRFTSLKDLDQSLSYFSEEGNTADNIAKLKEVPHEDQSTAEQPEETLEHRSDEQSSANCATPESESPKTIKKLEGYPAVDTSSSSNPNLAI